MCDTGEDQGKKGVQIQTHQNVSASVSARDPGRLEQLMKSCSVIGCSQETLEAVVEGRTPSWTTRTALTPTTLDRQRRTFPGGRDHCASEDPSCQEPPRVQHSSWSLIERNGRQTIRLHSIRALPPHRSKRMK